MNNYRSKFKSESWAQKTDQHILPLNYIEILRVETLLFFRLETTKHWINSFLDDQMHLTFHIPKELGDLFTIVSSTNGIGDCRGFNSENL